MDDGRRCGSLFCRRLERTVAERYFGTFVQRPCSSVFLAVPYDICPLLQGERKYLDRPFHESCVLSGGAGAVLRSVSEAHKESHSVRRSNDFDWYSQSSDAGAGHSAENVYDAPAGGTAFAAGGRMDFTGGPQKEDVGGSVSASFCGQCGRISDPL